MASQPTLRVYENPLVSVSKALFLRGGRLTCHKNGVGGNHISPVTSGGGMFHGHRFQI